MKKGDVVKFKNPTDEREATQRFTLMEDPDGGRVLAEAIVNMEIRPTAVYSTDDLELANEESRS